MALKAVLPPAEVSTKNKCGFVCTLPLSLHWDGYFIFRR